MMSIQLKPEEYRWCVYSVDINLCDTNRSEVLVLVQLQFSGGVGLSIVCQFLVDADA